MATPTPKSSDKSEGRVSITAVEADKKPKPISPARVAAIAEAKAKQVAKSQVGGFTGFIRDQGVVGVGIGLVLGIQVKAVVDTVMDKFVNPVTQLLLPGQKALSGQSVSLHFNDKAVSIGWGAVVYSLFTFVMVAVIVYAAYKLLKLERLAKKKD